MFCAHLPGLASAQRTLSVLQESGDVLKALQNAMHTPNRGPVKVAALTSALATAQSRGFDCSAEDALPEAGACSPHTARDSAKRGANEREQQ